MRPRGGRGPGAWTLAAARLSDGRIVVANQGSNEIRYFGREGSFLQAVGGTGDGPGEFRFLDGIWRWKGDTLLAPDRFNNRVSVFDAEGRFVRAFDVVGADGDSRPFKLGLMDDGTIVASTVLRVEPSSRGIRQDSVRYLALGPEGGFVGEIARKPYLRLFTTELDGRRLFGRVPFSPSPILAVGDHRVFVGVGDRFELRGFRSDGTLDLLIRRDHRPRPVGEPEIAGYRARRVDGLSDESERRLARRILDDAPFPSHQPAMESALVDEEGHLWVENFAFPPDGPTVWSVFSPEGVWESDVTLPPGFETHEVGSDYVLGVRRDELGIERISLLALRRGG